VREAIVPSVNRIALITGASSGIGRALARLFARDGYELVLVARSEAALNRVADELSNAHHTPVTVIAKDLSVQTASEEVWAASGGRSIDVLVNGAGFAVYGPFTDTSIEAELELMRLNMMALTHLTKLCAAGMVERRSGRILNSASTAAFQPGPLMAVYYASKAYVLSLSEALANELAPFGVGVSVLCPGPTRTGFQQRAQMEQSKLFDFGAMEADVVALAGYRGLMRNKTVIVPGTVNKLLAAATRLAPRKLLPVIVRRLQEPRQ